MRRIIADIFKFFYKLSSNKLFSLSAALIYISTLNLVSIYGLFYVLRGFRPFLGVLLIAYKRPYIFLLILAMLVFNFLLVLPLQNLSKERSKPYAVAPIIIYTLVSFLLYIYAHFADRLF